MSEESHKAIRVARQVAEANRLTGVDFLPRRPNGPGSGSSTPEPVADGIPIVSRDVDVPLPPGHSDDIASKAGRLEDLRLRYETDCRRQPRTEGYTNIVFGEGTADARLMFIGEAPGAEEDRTGRPFVGRAGQKLEEIIKAMGLERKVVYIANVLKTRPPNNRTPLQHEIDLDWPFLEEQIDIIAPDVIVTLGGPATKLILSTDLGITKIRGQWAQYLPESRLGATGETSRPVPVMPTFHPAYLLRNYTPDTRKKVWSDMQAVMTRLQAAPSA